MAIWSREEHGVVPALAGETLKSDLAGPTGFDEVESRLRDRFLRIDHIVAGAVEALTDSGEQVDPHARVLEGRLHSSPLFSSSTTPRSVLAIPPLRQHPRAPHGPGRPWRRPVRPWHPRSRCPAPGLHGRARIRQPSPADHVADGVLSITLSDMATSASSSMTRARRTTSTPATASSGTGSRSGYHRIEDITDAGPVRNGPRPTMIRSSCRLGAILS